MRVTTVERPALSVRRCHGLGNVIMLLPVLEQLAGQGYAVRLVTQPQWVGALQRLNPRITVSDSGPPDTIDLDRATHSLRPGAHRGKEFADLLGAAEPTRPPRLEVPAEWSAPFARWEGAVGFAPEAGHPSRQWPVEYCTELSDSLRGSPLVILGTDPSPPMPCDLDTRGQLSLEELLGLLNVLRLLICMDSGMLHLGAGVGVPTICVFGGVAPAFRVHQSQRVLALQAALACCPCNKQEVCEGRFDCVKAIKPCDVLDSMEEAGRAVTSAVRRI
jgi:hypothetical protein